jgi:hypothetical protein
VSTAVQPKPLESPAGPIQSSRQLIAGWPWWPISLTALILLGAAVPVSAVHDLLTGAPVAGVHLARSAAYVVMAPLSDVLDALTLLSSRQHVALGVTLLVVFSVWRVLRRRVRIDVGRRHVEETKAAALFAGSVLAMYAAAVALPRPMARLVLDDASQIAVDFHSHTDASHDARFGFGVDANRSWHAAAGYGAAYVSDHHSFRGAIAGLATNPLRAANGTLLLPALEAAYQDEHVIVVGSSHDAGTAPVRQWADSRLPRDAAAGLVMTIPGVVARFQPSRVRQTPVLGIELSDGCPRGLAESDMKRDSIVALATSLGAALLTGSDNHGWGHAAVAWSVLSISEWREMTAEQLDAGIRARLASDRTQAVVPIARTRVVSRDLLGLATIAPAATWTLVRTMTWGERVSWIVWIWLAALMLSGARFARSRARRRARLHLVSVAGPISH